MAGRAGEATGAPVFAERGGIRRRLTGSAASTTGLDRIIGRTPGTTTMVAGCALARARIASRPSAAVGVALTGGATAPIAGHCLRFAAARHTLRARGADRAARPAIERVTLKVDAGACARGLAAAAGGGGFLAARRAEHAQQRQRRQHTAVGCASHVRRLGTGRVVVNNGLVNRVVLTCLCLICTCTYAQGLGPEKAVLGGAPTAIPGGASSIVFDGQNYFVAWSGLTPGADPYNLGVYGVHVTPAGGVVEALPFSFTGKNAQSLAPAVAYSNGAYLVAWTDKFGGPLRFACLDGSGKVLDPGGTLLITEIPLYGVVAAAAVGDTFLITYSQGYNGQGARAVRVATSGVVIDSTPISLSSQAVASPALTSDGSRFYLAWPERNAANTDNDTHAAELDVYGQVTDRGVIGHFAPSAMIYADAGSGPQLMFAAYGVDGWGFTPGFAPIDSFTPFLANNAPQLTFDGTRYWFTAINEQMNGQSDTLFARVSTSGQLLDGAPRAVGTAFYSQTSPSVGSDFNHVLLAHPLPNGGLGGELLDGTGATLMSTQISQAMESASGPRVAPLGSSFVVAAVSTSAPWLTAKGRVATLGADGSVDAGMTFGSTAVSAIGVDRSGYVLWSAPANASYSSANDIWVQLLAPDGASFQYASDLGPGATPAIASSPDVVAVVSTWAGLPVVRRWTRAPPHSLIDTQPTRIAFDTQAGQMAIDYASGSFLVVWASGVGGRGVIRSTFLSADSMVPPVVRTGPALGDGVDDEAPAVAASANEWLVAYEEHAGAGHAIRAAFLGPDRVREFEIARSTLPLRRPAAVAAGDLWALAWEREDADGGADVVGTWLELNPDGGVWTSGFEAATTPADERAPALAFTPAQGVAIAFQRNDSNAIAATLVRVASVPRFDLCQSSTDCPSGFCVDGVCCDSACGGGATDDCLACSVAAGASVDGRCAPLSHGTICRAASGQCDEAEVCDGHSASCPSDALRSDGSVCDDGDTTTNGDRCVAGQCRGDAASICAPGSTCGPTPPVTKKSCGCSTFDALSLLALTSLVRMLRRR
ncbi:MAG: hypothetical protein QM723_20225 [Myxococcaceae bacterium]